MKRILSSAIGLSLFASAAAFASAGYVTRSVSLRAGPDASYPAVARLRAGSSVDIEGCIDGWSWCDVGDGQDRGWMAGRYLQQEYEGRRVLVPTYGVQIGIPIVSFTFGSYWQDHYQSRSWYGQRDHWSHVQPHYGSVTLHSEAPYGSYQHPVGSAHASSSATTNASVYRAPEHEQPATHTSRPAYQQHSTANVTASASTPQQTPSHRSGPRSEPAVQSDHHASQNVASHHSDVQRAGPEHPMPAAVAPTRHADAQAKVAVARQVPASNGATKPASDKAAHASDGGHERGKDKDGPKGDGQH